MDTGIMWVTFYLGACCGYALALVLRHSRMRELEDRLDDTKGVLAQRTKERDELRMRLRLRGPW